MTFDLAADGDKAPEATKHDIASEVEYGESKWASIQGSLSSIDLGAVRTPPFNTSSLIRTEKDGLAGISNNILTKNDLIVTLEIDGVLYNMLLIDECCRNLVTGRELYVGLMNIMIETRGSMKPNLEALKFDISTYPIRP